MERIACGIVLVFFLIHVYSFSEPEPGYDLWFTTNLDEMIRNGDGRFELGHRNVTHLFDAFGKLSSWKFYKNGSASFSTKFLQSDFYKDSVDKNDIAPYLIFESVQPPFNEIQKLEELVRGVDNMNVNIYRFYNPKAGIYEYAALNDIWKLYQVDPFVLDTMKSITPKLPNGGRISGFEFISSLSSAHPLPEFGTTNHFTFVSSISLIPGIKSRMTLVRITSMAEREEVAHWSVDRVPYIHSFSVTEKYVILFAAPFYVNVVNIVRYASSIKGMDWVSEDPTAVYVVDIKTGNVTTLKTDNIFTLHHINAFESGQDIIVDISSYPNPNFVKNLEVSILKDPVKRNLFDAHAYLRRYIITLSKNKIIYEPIPSTKAVPFSNNLDMPAINEKFRSKEYCYVYGTVSQIDNVTLSRLAIVKKDFCQNNDKYWFVEHQYVVEPWFVPSPHQTSEDDGVLIVPILDGLKKQSYLAIIDAVTMKTINSAVLPTIVPFNLHGRFFDGVV